jgi:hypothetical protein
LILPTTTLVNLSLDYNNLIAFQISRLDSIDYLHLLFLHHNLTKGFKSPTMSSTLPRPPPCTKDTCPASQSIYGYAPNLPTNAFFVAVFAISCLTFCYQARLYRKWLGFSIAMILGTALESIGSFLPTLSLKDRGRHC